MSLYELHTMMILLGYAYYTKYGIITVCQLYNVYQDMPILYILWYAHCTVDIAYTLGRVLLASTKFSDFALAFLAQLKFSVFPL